MMQLKDLGLLPCTLIHFGIDCLSFGEIFCSSTNASKQPSRQAAKDCFEQEERLLLTERHPVRNPPFDVAPNAWTPRWNWLPGQHGIHGSFQVLTCTAEKQYSVIG
jgi:hypothetical protein